MHLSACFGCQYSLACSYVNLSTVSIGTVSSHIQYLYSLCFPLRGIFEITLRVHLDNPRTNLFISISLIISAEPNFSQMRQHPQSPGLRTRIPFGKVISVLITASQNGISEWEWEDCIIDLVYLLDHLWMVLSNDY